jgi:hypothetical protein
VGVGEGQVGVGFVLGCWVRVGFVLVRVGWVVLVRAAYVSGGCWVFCWVYVGWVLGGCWVGVG